MHFRKYASITVMCDGPSPCQPCRPTWQFVLIASSLKPNWNSSNSQRKERTAQLYYYTEDDFFDECKSWLQSTSEENRHLNQDKHTKQKLARNQWSYNFR